MSATTDTRLASAVWSGERLGELLEALTKVSKLREAAPLPQGQGLPAKAPPPAGAASLSLFLDWTCQHLGCEAEPASVTWDAVPQLLERAAPALLRLRLEAPPADPTTERAPIDARAGYLALFGCRRRRAQLLAPSGATIEVPVDELRSHLCADVEAVHERDIERLLDTAGVVGRRREEARRALVARRLGDAPLRGVWLLRERGSHPFTKRLLRAGLGRRLAALVVTHALQTALFIASWWLVGKAFLDGNLPEGWLGAWLLLLATLVPLRLVATWLQGDLAIRAGAATKERLYAGALKLDPDEVKKRGVGQLMGSVLESEAVEAQALSGGFLALLGGIELLFALAVLAIGAASFAQPIALAATVATMVTLTWSYTRERRSWTDQRLAMTHTLIEKIVGHRTRTVQEPREGRHREEDQSLDSYAAASRRLDGRAVAVVALLPRAWILLAVVALVPAFVGGATSTSLAIALGGALLAYRALGKTTTGLTNLADAAISWREVEPMFAAAKAEEPPGTSPPVLAVSEGKGTLLEAKNLRYTYPGRPRPVLDGCDLEIKRGDRILLTGRSGSGKSTLLAILSGLRAGHDGLTLLGGRDATTAGARAWRANVGTVLQHHESHLFSEPFLFNLAAGSTWPPSREDLEKATALCHDLDLDPLLERMPGRLNQAIGEGGWRLSHGERARLGLARALLTGAGLVVGDETFGVLDRKTQRRAVEAARRRAPALLVVGHT